ncbi:DUF2157 domain-containing protein [Rickettsiales endosymbiont of Paramecium tredecaurelia]|uniref:DUF2157 domain-containing protein n=1 Tax=Candidatus Sarmatiella mevalonica TaxID=2770581 RepID=UPI0019249610|nr:DUF2157 domain-containing protein [Candidatus Sarmatiella mevalonica]MBL3284327.1 DUF2157 domain-containing protein [Candidatus Sarmatiella mevalonica]
MHIINLKLSLLGAALITIGIINLFVVNWLNIPVVIKLLFVYFAIITAVVLAITLNNHGMVSQTSMLLATILVYVFLTMLNTQYHLALVDYKLFITWALLIFSWTFISRCAMQWLAFLSVLNLACITWQCQTVQLGMILWKGHQYELPKICISLISLNLCALLTREYLVTKRSYIWLNGEWFRVVLCAKLVICASIPLLLWIFNGISTSSALCLVAGMFGIFVYSLMYYLYRYKTPSVYTLFIIFFGACAVIEIFLIKQLMAIHGRIKFWLISITAILLFSLACLLLRKTIEWMRNEHNMKESCGDYGK